VYGRWRLKPYVVPAPPAAVFDVNHFTSASRSILSIRLYIYIGLGPAMAGTATALGRALSLGPLPPCERSPFDLSFSLTKGGVP